MDAVARTAFSLEPESFDAGRLTGEALAGRFGADGAKAVIAYSTMNHDQPRVLEGLRAALGPDVSLLGCSVQGVVSNAELAEEGMALGVMGFGGRDLLCAAAVEHEIQDATKEKGRRMAKGLKRDLGEEPKLVVVLYDPLSGVDVETLLEGLRMELDCPLVGGGAGQPWGTPVQTFQYWDREVFSHGVVALALGGPFATEVGICHGTAPTGIASVVTRMDGNQILEMDGRPVADVWREATGCEASEMVDQDHFAQWALAVAHPNGGSASTAAGPARVIRGAFGINPNTGAIVMQAAIPEGTNVMFHHRTIEDVLNGTQDMALDLGARLAGLRPWAVLGFECGARTFPFLGPSNTLKEHEQLRTAIAPEAAWLGMMAWGEIGPCAGKPAFHNYTYPLVVLAHEPK